MFYCSKNQQKIKKKKKSKNKKQTQAKTAAAMQQGFQWHNVHLYHLVAVSGFKSIPGFSPVQRNWEHPQQFHRLIKNVG